MKIKLAAVVLLALIMSGPARAAMLSDAEATFLDQLVTASAVLEQRCVGYEVNGAGSVQLGARLLGSTDAAMARPPIPVNFAPKCPTRPPKRSGASGPI